MTFIKILRLLPEMVHTGNYRLLAVMAVFYHGPCFMSFHVPCLDNVMSTRLKSNTEIRCIILDIMHSSIWSLILQGGIGGKLDGQ